MSGGGAKIPIVGATGGRAIQIGGAAATKIHHLMPRLRPSCIRPPFAWSGWTRLRMRRSRSFAFPRRSTRRPHDLRFPRVGGWGRRERHEMHSQRRGLHFEVGGCGKLRAPPPLSRSLLFAHMGVSAPPHHRLVIKRREGIPAPTYGQTGKAGRLLSSCGSVAGGRRTGLLKRATLRTRA